MKKAEFYQNRFPLEFLLENTESEKFEKMV
jgi:hypothetical protein